ncbi:hypothetical protein BC936DRAFT_143879 [Jimgerdemannia flammicorona]|uniref:RRM domain-containing protein n=1 Tax=Jimgerdemannia flammicorona TaxID=994334 RepID=A0A432ZYV2_9FUNG|nr:hypothetical protein BC936DRAFT_143879 [Jimgerdemannia flammicorona]
MVAVHNTSLLCSEPTKSRTNDDLATNCATIIFSADRAYALFNNILLAQHGCLLKLNMNDPNTANEPEVNANILQVKSLGPSTDNTFLYNLFRPYGALQYCRTVLDNSRFKGVALVQYFRQEDADDAQRELVRMMVEIFLAE